MPLRGNRAYVRHTKTSTKKKKREEFPCYAMTKDEIKKFKGVSKQMNHMPWRSRDEREVTNEQD